MKYLYTIEEQYVVEDCVGVKKERNSSSKRHKPKTSY